MDANDITVMRRTAKMEADAARRDLLLSIERMERELADARRDIEKGGYASHQAMNYGQYVAKFCEASGRLRTFDAMSDWFKEGT